MDDAIVLTRAMECPQSRRRRRFDYRGTFRLVRDTESREDGAYLVEWWQTPDEIEPVVIGCARDLGGERPWLEIAHPALALTYGADSQVRLRPGDFLADACRRLLHLELDVLAEDDRRYR